MINNYTPEDYETIINYEITFDDGRNNGYAFPCDENGNLVGGLSDAAISNYQWCLNHPEEFERFNKIIRFERRVRNNARGICDCGNEVELYNEYMGACQCEKCGQWYNLFGQKLMPPSMWEDDY